MKGMPEYLIPKDSNCFFLWRFGAVCWCFLLWETHGIVAGTDLQQPLCEWLLTASRPLLHRQISHYQHLIDYLQNLWEFVDFWIGYTSPYIFENTQQFDQCITSKQVFGLWLRRIYSELQVMGSPPAIQRCVGELRTLGLRRVPSWSNGHFFRDTGHLRRCEVITEVTDFEPLASWTCFYYLSCYSSIWGITMRDEWVVILVIIGKSAVLEAVGGGVFVLVVVLVLVYWYSY